MQFRFSDPAYREELGYWIGQGVFGAPWLISKMMQLAVTYLNMGKKGGKERFRSADERTGSLTVFSSKTNDRQSQIRVGQVFERLCLAATVAGIRVHPMNQILQIPELKAEVTKLIPMPDVVPQITFRLGYAEAEKKRTPRRQLDEVLV